MRDKVVEDVVSCNRRKVDYVNLMKEAIDRNVASSVS